MNREAGFYKKEKGKGAPAGDLVWSTVGGDLEKRRRGTNMTGRSTKSPTECEDGLESQNTSDLLNEGVGSRGIRGSFNKGFPRRWLDNGKKSVQPRKRDGKSSVWGNRGKGRVQSSAVLFKQERKALGPI